MEKNEHLTKKIMKTPEFYEEMLLLNAQELIAQLMNERDVSKADLARSLKKSKAHITSLLDDGRNLTLKSLAKVCYHLGAEVKIDAVALSHSMTKENNTYKEENNSYK